MPQTKQKDKFIVLENVFAMGMINKSFNVKNNKKKGSSTTEKWTKGEQADWRLSPRRHGWLRLWWEMSLPTSGTLCLQPMFLFTLLTWVLGSPSTPCPAQKLLHFLRAPSQSLPCIPARCPHLHLIAVALSCKTGGLKICFRFHIYIVLTYIYHHV